MAAVVWMRPAAGSPCRGPGHRSPPTRAGRAAADPAPWVTSARPVRSTGDPSSSGARHAPITGPTSVGPQRSGRYRPCPTTRTASLRIPRVPLPRSSCERPAHPPGRRRPGRPRQRPGTARRGAAPGGGDRRWVRWPQRRTRAGSRCRRPRPRGHARRQAQPPHLPAAALPGRHRRPPAARHRDDAPLHPRGASPRPRRTPDAPRSGSARSSVSTTRVVVLADGARLPYDHLIVAAGGITNDLGIPGVAEHAFGLKSLAEATQLRNHLLRRFEAASSDPRPPRRRHPDLRGRRRRTDRRRARRRARRAGRPGPAARTTRRSTARTCASSCSR